MMYELTKDAKSQFVKIFGYNPETEQVKKILRESYCVQFFKIFIRLKNSYLIRPEIYFHPKTETCFACDRYKRKIFAIYKAEKGFKEVSNIDVKSA